MKSGPAARTAEVVLGYRLAMAALLASALAASSAGLLTATAALVWISCKTPHLRLCFHFELSALAHASAEKKFPRVLIFKFS